MSLTRAFSASSLTAELCVRVHSSHIVRDHDASQASPGGAAKAQHHTTPFLASVAAGLCLGTGSLCATPGEIELARIGRPDYGVETKRFRFILLTPLR
jgi:hypothetical protein